MVEEDSLRTFSYGEEIADRMFTKGFLKLCEGQPKAKNGEIPDMDLIPENNVKIHTRQGVDVHFDTRACVAV